MPALLSRGRSSSPASPVLTLFTAAAGRLVEAASASYRILDVSTPVKRQTPVVVHASTVCNVGTDAPAGDRLGKGHYLARWTVPNNQVGGRHRIEWTYTLPDADPVTWSVDFDVIEGGGLATASLGYVLVADLRDEGVSASSYADEVLLDRITFAARQVERWTRRFFEPRAMTLRVSGSNSPVLRLRDPIIGIESVTIAVPSLGQPVGADDYVIYARHLTGQTSPDDRADPRIEYADSTPLHIFPPVALQRWSNLWPKGTQNIEVRGVFGYTDPDGSAVGMTPYGLRRATKLLVVRDLAPLGPDGAEDRFDAQNRYRLTSESTRGQSYSLAGGRPAGDFSGDPQIDDLLGLYVASMRIGKT